MTEIYIKIALIVLGIEVIAVAVLFYKSHKLDKQNNELINELNKKLNGQVRKN